MALPAVTPFEVLANVGACWKRWLNSFELYLVASGIRNDAWKRALLQHLPRAKVQDIFFTMDDTTDGGYVQ
ncbi:zinc finger BED domain-containing 4-like isoform X3 [Xyrichtys novacula]|uniref:Zinc finger BED domain-containing 4-like isoform X3 n=1 Tax=Xyrichtys novacula TaxID=13765 RepID=A0AAV1EHJ4_XYRNO|nr:zinc finger BED domain-containing 4-like isoform X3 [Xyrichtys novacula]